MGLLKKMLAARRAADDPEPRPMTRADKVRAMTDEELAARAAEFVSCAVCPMLGACKSNVYRCAAYWTGYLKAVEV